MVFHVMLDGEFSPIGGHNPRMPSFASELVKLGQRFCKRFTKGQGCCRMAMEMVIFWLVVSNTFYFPFHIWDAILPIDELIFFRGVG
jgi:hypothetical protein